MKINWTKDELYYTQITNSLYLLEVWNIIYDITLIFSNPI